MKKVGEGKWVTRSDSGKYAIIVDPKSVLFEYRVFCTYNNEKLGPNTTSWKQAIRMIEEAQTKDALALQALKQKNIDEAIRCGCDVPDEQKDQVVFHTPKDGQTSRHHFCRDCAIQHYREKLNGVNFNLARSINGASRTLEQTYKRRLKELGVWA